MWVRKHGQVSGRKNTARSLSQANTHVHTLLVATGFERENPDIFVLPSLLPGICLPVQVSCAATRGQKDATDCVLKSKLQNLCSP